MFEAFTSLNTNQCETPTSRTFSLMYHPIVNQMDIAIVGGVDVKCQTTVKLALSAMKLSSLHKVKSFRET